MHEKEEKRRLSKGMKRVWAALALCWLPVVGLLLSVGGYLRVMVRVTRKYKRRRSACLVCAFLVMALCTGVLLAEVKLYSRDPEILSRITRTVWTKIVGEENAARFYPEDGESADDDTALTDWEDEWQFGFEDDFTEGDDLNGTDWSEGDWTDEEWDAMFGSDDWLTAMDTDGDGFISFEDEWPEGDIQDVTVSDITEEDPTSPEKKAGSVNIGQGSKIVLPTE